MARESVNVTPRQTVEAAIQRLEQAVGELDVQHAGSLRGELANLRSSVEHMQLVIDNHQEWLVAFDVRIGEIHQRIDELHPPT